MDSGSHHVPQNSPDFLVIRNRQFLAEFGLGHTVSYKKKVANALAHARPLCFDMTRDASVLMTSACRVWSSAQSECYLADNDLTDEGARLFAEAFTRQSERAPGCAADGDEEEEQEEDPEDPEAGTGPSLMIESFDDWCAMRFIPHCSAA